MKLCKNRWTVPNFGNAYMEPL